MLCPVCGLFIKIVSVRYHCTVLRLPALPLGRGGTPRPTCGRPGPAMRQCWRHKLRPLLAWHGKTLTNINHNKNTTTNSRTCETTPQRPHRVLVVALLVAREHHHLQRHHKPAARQPHNLHIVQAASLPHKIGNRTLGPNAA